jgi:hypothetical protein
VIWVMISVMGGKNGGFVVGKGKFQVLQNLLVSP